MRIQKLIFLFCLFNAFLSISQTSIPSELMNKPKTEDLYKIRGNNIKNVKATEVNYLKNETYTNEWVFNYSADTLITGKLLKDEELKSVFEYTLNKEKSIIETKVSFFNKAVRNGSLHIKYQINDSLKIFNILDDNLKAKSKVIVEMDSLKSPIKITFLNMNDEIQSKETAKYNYKSNTYEYKIYNSYDQVVLDKVENYNYDFIIEKNEIGDITKMIAPLSKSRSVINFEYKYDKYGNWTKRIKKRFENNKEITSSIVTRNIKYSN